MSNYIQEEIIDEVKSRNDIVGVVSEYLKLKKSGRNYLALCPFHVEKTPSFSVSHEKQIFHCFGCGVGGNVINFIMNIEKLNFTDAVKMLAAKSGVSIPDSNAGYNKKENEYRNRLYEINREAGRYYYSNLISKKGEGAGKYLENRGLSKNTINTFGLGYSLNSWDGLYTYLKSKGYDDKLMNDAGLVLSPKNRRGYYDRFRNRIMFPIFDYMGRILGFGGRVMDASLPKYINSPETDVFKKGFTLYSLNIAKKEVEQERIIVVEGYMDVVSLYEKGVKNAVASLGTAFTKQQGLLLKRYCNNIVIAYDGDTAGEAAAVKGLDILREIGCSVYIVQFPDKTDPDDFIRTKGVQAFKNKVDNALPLIEYKMDLLKRKYDTGKAEERTKLAQGLVRIISVLDSPIEMDVYIKEIETITGVSRDAIYGYLSKSPGSKRKLINKNIIGNNRYNKTSKPEKKPVEGYIKAERNIITIILEDNSLFPVVSAKLDQSDFTDSLCRQVAKILYDRIEKGKKVKTSDIVDYFKNKDEINLLSEIFHKKVEYDNIEKFVGQCIKTIKEHNMKVERKEIELKIEELGKKGDVDSINCLLKKLMDLNKQVRL